jgi:hypothetical protein
LRCNSKVDIGCNEELEKKIFEEIKEELKKWVIEYTWLFVKKKIGLII